MTKRAMILGTGMSVPPRVMTNADLEKLVDTSDEWIVGRTGIKERRIVAPGVGLSDLGSEAAARALGDAGVDAKKLDLIIVATVSGDMRFPATACTVQHRIGAVRAAALDVSAACSGTLYALKLANGLIAAGEYEHVLVIGGDILSAQVDWTDRSTCVLFGDGAGAIVLGPGQDDRGFLTTYIQSDGAYVEILYSLGPESTGASGVTGKRKGIQMNGREVYRQAVHAMSRSLKRVLTDAHVSPAELKLVIAHQANARIIDAVAKQCELAPEKVFKNVDRYGNTSAASIPIALTEARQAGAVAKGDLVALAAFGAGMTWGASLLRL